MKLIAQTILVTGSAGFVGFHLAKLLLDEGFNVVGCDSMTDYYDVRLKFARHQILDRYGKFSGSATDVEDFSALRSVCDRHRPDVIVHFAARPGVRHSVQYPRSVIETNVIGTTNVAECARHLDIQHLLIASSSSVYGGSNKIPFTENDRIDEQISVYAASKKASESIAHSYAHLWNTPTTLFRFFTVYGPWGRPDMALFKFTRNILEGAPIDIYNHGNLRRDFTFVTDLVKAVRLLMDVVPEKPGIRLAAVENDSLSSTAPFRVVNIGNSQAVKLSDFIELIENELGQKAKRNYMELQRGDPLVTLADSSLLFRLTGYRPETDIGTGVKKFIQWYLEDFHQRQIGHK